MEITTGNTRIDVEKLASTLLARMTTRPRFRWNIPERQAVDTLTACYMAEVRYRCRTYDPGCAEVIRRVAAILTAPTPRLGMLLCGLCGIGKSTMLRAVRTGTSMIDGTRKLRLISAREMAELYRDTDSRTAIKREELLAVDDVGCEPKELLDYGNIYTPVCDLIEYRYNNQLYTILSTNLTPKDMTARYGERIGDRLNEMLDIVTFGGESYRRKQNENKG